MPRHIAAVSKRSAAVYERIRLVADAISKSLRQAPPFDPKWPTVTPEDLATGPVQPPFEPGPSERALDVDAVTALLAQNSTRAALDAGRKLMAELLRDGDFASLVKVAKAVHERAPAEVETTIRYAQGLLETGSAGDAEGLLSPVVSSLTRKSPELLGATALLGRASSERFIAATSETSRESRSALLRAIKAYRRGYEVDPTKHLEHGVRLVALLSAAQR